MKHHKSKEQKEREAELIIEEFAKAGMYFEKKKKTPRNGEYSGPVGNRNKVLEVNI